MRTFLILALLATSARADLVLLYEDDTIGSSGFFAQGPVSGGSSAGQHFFHTNRSGNALLHSNDTILSLFDVSFTRPAHTIDFTVDTVAVHIEVDPMTWTLPEQHLPVTENLGTSLKTAGFPMQQWNTIGNHSGTYTLTGFEGTVVAGTFDFGISNNTTPSQGLSWTVTDRNGSPILGEIAGMQGFLGPGTTGGEIWNGNIDGIEFRFASNGQGNGFFLSGPTSIPEPGSLGMLSLASCCLAGLRVRRI